MLVGLIPAAGHATRLALRAGSKEMLRIRGRPVMDHLVARLRAARVDELRVITRPEKEDLVRHCARLGAVVVPGHPIDVAASLKLGLAGLQDHDEVLFGFPDTLWEPENGFVPVLAALRGGARVALGLFETPDLQRSDVVAFGADGEIAGIEVKPAVPPSDVIWGIAAAHAGTLAGLQEGTEPGVYFGRLAEGGGVVGVRLSSEWIDVGTPESLSRARAW